MNSAGTAPPAAADGGGAARTGRRGTGRRRRARNRRYRQNRATRSLLTIVVWNAEGLRSKTAELSPWLSEVRADVVAIREGQFGKAAPSIPGFQPPVVSRRSRGRRAGGPAKGGDVAIYVRDGRPFSILPGPLKPAADDTTELCGIRLCGDPDLQIINVYRPPIRPDDTDERVDRFDPEYLPGGDNVIVAGDFNAHHPLWDAECEEADEVGDRTATWLDRRGWAVLNDAAQRTPVTVLAARRRPTWPSAAPPSPSYPPGARAATWAATTSRCSSKYGPQAPPPPPSRIRKTRWSFKKANWQAFEDECEAAFSEPAPARDSVQEQATRFHAVLRRASTHHVPRGAREGGKPWDLDPELEEAVEARRAARRDMRSGDREAKQRWVAAKQRAASVERRVSQRDFRSFVSTELNRNRNLGRVHKILKKWEGPPGIDIDIDIYWHNFPYMHSHTFIWLFQAVCLHDKNI